MTENITAYVLIAQNSLMITKEVVKVDIDKWVTLIRKTKPATKEYDFICYSNKERTIQELKGTKTIKITFFKPQSLTVFEAQLLYSVFAMGRKPFDYAQYHKCKAGEEFISNIKALA